MVAWLKRLLGRESEIESESAGERQGEEDPTPEVSWVEAADNPWGVRVLDVRPVTLTMLSSSADPQCAANALSFGQEDGTAFIGELPPVTRTTQASLTFPIDGGLAEGVLFQPREMEHKWALFYLRGHVICVRSWQRKVLAVARLELHENENYAEVTEVRGVFGEQDEDPELTVRTLDYLLRSHALDLTYPAPLSAGQAEDPKAAAWWCFSMFGNRARYATPHHFERGDPERPLRTLSLLHIAVARGEGSEVEAHLAAGMPIDLWAGDGLAPLHWAVAADDTSMMHLLLDRGSPVDVRSIDGATPLMAAVQSATLNGVRLLLDRGADVNARDRRGFTSLHRAAEMGLLDIVRALLDGRAAPDVEAEGHTARSLAEVRGHGEIVAVLVQHGASGG
jgi:hypothetical protein